MGGAAYVSFVTEQDYQAFRGIVLSTSHVLVDGQPDSEVRERLRDPAYLEETAEKGGCWAVGFPPEDLRAVTAAARDIGESDRTCSPGAATEAKEVL